MKGAVLGREVVRLGKEQPPPLSRVGVGDRLFGLFPLEVRLMLGSKEREREKTRRI
jgi:hypothetical protein